MGSNSGDAQAKGIDSTPGNLVWVQRRNGSWWPGRVVGPEEFPENSSPCPSVGTPVKLLGREDVSVECYNLETSKRVKPFRCEDYGKFVEKSNTSAANSSKKSVKYSQRDIAILHALELESARLSKEQAGLGSRADILGNEQQDDGSPTSFNHRKESDLADVNSSKSEDNSISGNQVSQCKKVSFEERNHVNSFKEEYIAERQHRKLNDSEDDGTEGSRRMKGLEDLGIAAVSFKRKRSQLAQVHEVLKRKNRRRPSMKAFKNTAMVSVPISCEQLPSPTGSPFSGASGKLSGHKSDKSRKSFTMIGNKKEADSNGVFRNKGTLCNAYGQSIDVSVTKCQQEENENSSLAGFRENDSFGSLFDVPFIAEEKPSGGLSTITSCTPQETQTGAGVQSSPSSQVEYDSGSASLGTVNIYNSVQRIEQGTSEWQMKGKRKSRHASKIKNQDSCKSTDVDNGSEIYLAGTDQALLSCPPSQRVAIDPTVGSLSSEICANNLKSSSLEVGDVRGWTRNVTHEEEKVILAEMHPPQRTLPYRQSRFTVNPKYESSDFCLRRHILDSSLYDVRLEVKASSHTRLAPYVSLTSKLSIQPITGHPLKVEVLEDGFCDQLMSNPNSHGSFDENLLQNVGSAAKVGSCRRNYSKQRMRQTGASSTKSRRTGIISKKIRKLSSLTKKSQQQKKPTAKKLNRPTVACIPLKLVFSRLNAALSSSMRPSISLTAPSNS